MKKSPGLKGFNELYQTFKELTTIFLKSFHEIERERILLNSFCEGIITLIPKLDKVTIKKRRIRLISLMCSMNAKILNKILAK
jgi:F0F1-type ATP synthase delta subunit